MEKIEIPSHFLCPISLQLMRDPVTLCTGITYDRDSIERWIYVCKNATCPVTKQSIRNDNIDAGEVIIIITPNHTLRRLIQSWCKLHASDGVECIPTPTQISTVDHAQIKKLMLDAKRSPKLLYTCLQKIRSLLSCSDGRTRKVLEGSGVFPYVVSIITDVSNSIEKRDKEEALWILTHHSASEKELKAALFNNDSIDEESFIDGVVVEFLTRGSAEAKGLAVRLLRSLYRVVDPSKLANASRQLFGETVKLLGEQVSHQASKYALKLLMELNPWGRNRVKAVEAGAVTALLGLLMDRSDRRVCELGLVVLDQLCGCAEGRADLVGHPAGLAVVSKKILRVSHVASDRAVRILSSISRYSATNKVVVEMVEVGVVAKLCLVIQVECNGKTKERAKEILRLHSRVWKNSPCLPPHLISSFPH